MMQLALGLDTPTITPSCPPPDEVPMPGACQYEQATVQTSDLGNSIKSLCTIRGTEIWTNCRTWGRCTMRGDVFGGAT